ncbi:MAG: hypothetical protein QG602_3457 [Verrucomicrobiota bacterium]|nr:hypothetical protein [Verrucomicrobiota bacterium]
MNRRHLTALVLAIVMLVACATHPQTPTPFPDGKPTMEPRGCTDLRKRDGEC